MSHESIYKDIYRKNLILLRLTASKLREQIDDSSKYLFDRRTEMDWIILIDWEESKKNQSLSKPIWVLYDVLTKVCIKVYFKAMNLLCDYKFYFARL